MESDSLGFSVIENRESLRGVLTTADWQQVLETGSFGGYSHNQVYFSFLKGLPDQLYLRINEDACEYG